MKTMKRKINLSKNSIRTMCVCTALIASCLNIHSTDITALGVIPGANKDNTQAVQEALNSSNSMIYFSEGTYKIGTVFIPGNKVLVFDPQAVITPNPDMIKDKKLFIVTGDHVRFEGLYYDFTWNGANVETTPVHNLIYAEEISHLTVTKANVKNSDERGIVPIEKRKRRGRLLDFNGNDPAEKYNHLGYYNSQFLLQVVKCNNVVLENSVGYRLHAMIEAISSTNITSRGNHMVSGNYMTRMAEGGECLRHHDNWSRDVKYQACWFGGSPDPSRKPELPRSSATVAIRQVKLGMEGYNKHTSGVYDILIQNNYAEYGNTLCWGNKGRQVVIDGNTARFISDYAYGTEGGENIVFSNNVSINSTAAGIVSMYWGEKLHITGNLIITRHEPWDPEWSWWDNPSKYLGPFVRLHHGPKDPEDHYGAGTVMISGNLFVNELTQRTCEISIHDGRDVAVMGNKLINGKVNKFGDGTVTVMNNEFVSRLPFDPLSISISRGAQMAIVKGNTFRKESNLIKASEEERNSELNAVPYFLFTENENIAEGDSNTNSPAIMIGAENKFFGAIEDNFIYGWNQAIKGDFKKNKQAATVVVNNTTDGVIDMKLADPSKSKIEKNTILDKGLMP